MSDENAKGPGGTRMPEDNAQARDGLAKVPKPRRLTPDVQAQIVDLLTLGNFRETAAAAAGIDSKTLRRWLRLGKDGHEPYAAFAEACDAAEATSEARDVGLIGMAAGADWKAAAWRQERKAPSRWGQRVRVEIDNELNSLLDRLERGLPPDVYQRVLALAAGDAGEDPPTPPDAEDD